MAVFTTYEAIGNRENLMDVITNISSTETPLFSGLKKVNATGKYMEWLTDSLATAATNAKVEGADYSFGTISPLTRVGNYTQIMNKPFQVSMTEEVVSKAGRDSEKAYQLEKATKELARDAEYELINSTVSAGTSAAARTMKGLLSWITTNVEVGSGSGSEALTEDMFNDALETIYAAGGRPDTAYVAGGQKRAISAFTTSNSRTIDASAGKLVNYVDVYASDFGMIEIVYDGFMSASVVAILQKDMWNIGILRPFKSKEVPSIGDSIKGVVEGEITLIAKNEASSGQITQLS